MKMIAVQNGFVLDLTVIKPLLHKRFSASLDAGIKAWVTTADRLIPTWSGASRATLIELGRKVGVEISIIPADGVKSRIALGQQSTPAPVIRKSRQFGEYFFQWSTHLTHLVTNETQDVNEAMKFRLRTPTPYEFRKAAGDAFRQALMAELKRESPESIIRKSLRVIQLRSK